MNRDNTISLIERLIHRIETNTTDEAPDMMTESVADFLCPAAFCTRKTAIFS
jgi:hypothetical protein